MQQVRRTLLALVVPWLLAACADPLQGVERLSDVDLPADGLAAAASPPPEEQADGPGFLSRLLAGTLTRGPGLGVDPSGALPTEALASGAAAALVPQPVGAADLATRQGTDAIEGDILMEEASRAEPPVPRRRGLFGLLDTLGTETPPAGNGPDATQIAPGTALAYGQIAAVCGLSPGDLGRPVGAASGYRVYDTNPASTALRTHYITGFDDGCARQVSAALALFGDVAMHEAIRYSPGTSAVGWSDTDNAYEEIKTRVCRVSAGQPCGTGLDRLARRTVFLTVYANFGSNPEWADVLLSDGQVVAMDFKG